MDLHRVIRATLFAIFLAVPATASAQAAQGPEVNVVLENDDVRMVAVTYQPGQASPEHTHAVPRTIYVVTGGDLEFTYPDGTTERTSMVAGEANWRAAETHAVRNVGTTEVVLVETEVRSAGTP